MFQCQKESPPSLPPSASCTHNPSTLPFPYLLPPHPPTLPPPPTPSSLHPLPAPHPTSSATLPHSLQAAGPPNASRRVAKARPKRSLQVGVEGEVCVGVEGGGGGGGICVGVEGFAWCGGVCVEGSTRRQRGRIKEDVVGRANQEAEPIDATPIHTQLPLTPLSPYPPLAMAKTPHPLHPLPAPSPASSPTLTAAPHPPLPLPLTLRPCPPTPAPVWLLSGAGSGAMWPGGPAPPAAQTQHLGEGVTFMISLGSGRR